MNKFVEVNMKVFPVPYPYEVKNKLFNLFVKIFKIKPNNFKTTNT